MSGHGRRAAVLGSPVAHSLSPVLHRAAYGELRLTDWSYDRFDVDETGLPGFFESPGPQWAGLSSAMPLLVDMLYDPWPTALAARCCAAGGAVVGGLVRLVHQAVLQAERMTGRVRALLDAMRRAGRATPGLGGTGPKAVLVGPMGVGKSTVGRLLAERLGVGYRDTDDDIVREQGRSITEIFADEGEPGFRAIEKRAVRRALAEHEGVLALGGGAVLDADTRAALAGRRVVYLSMNVEEAVRRTGLNAARPLLAVNAHDQWRELMEARRHLYAEVARVVVATDGRSPEEVTQAVLDELE